MLNKTLPSTPSSGRDSKQKLMTPDIPLLKSILKTPNTPRNSSGVHFEPPRDLSDTLKAAADNNLYRDELDGFITHMKNQKGTALVEWVQKIQENLNLLKPSLESFVLAILSIPWADQERPVVTAYKHFLTNLISAQSYYTKPVVKMLLTSMLGIKELKEQTKSQDEAFENSHEALQSVVKISPLAAHTAILIYGKSCMPFMMTPFTHMHTNYISNLLKITKYLPNERVSILTLVIDRLVQLDAHLPIGEDLYDFDDSDDSDTEEAPEIKMSEKKPSREQICRDNLDQGMKVIFDYIKENVDSANNSPSIIMSLFDDILKVFESNVLPSYATGHVQFIMFYLCSVSSKIQEKFMDYLWKRFTSPNTPSILRQTAIAYIASLIARAKFVDVAILRLYMKKITNWVHGYLSARVDSGNDFNYVDVRAHGPFYAASQALLYMLAFRYQELVQGPKSIDFLSKLGLARIVTCSLNPLKVCLPPVVKNFAAIARHYQLAYCETVIQRNNRLNLPVVGTKASTTSVIGDAKPALLDTFFPFDPYRLKESENFVKCHYREYQGSLLDENDSEEDSGDESESENDDSILEDVNLEQSVTTPKPKRRRLNSSGSFSGMLMDFSNHLGSPGFMKVE